MSPRHQVLGAVLLVLSTYLSMKRIAEAKNETAVGGQVFAVDTSRPAELQAFQSVVADIRAIGAETLAERLLELLARGEIWVGASMGPQRWAVFVDSLGLVRRIYIRRAALLDPAGHLFPSPRADIPLSHQRAFATIGLAGALRHEVAHRDGVDEEAAAYDLELAWYEQLRLSRFFTSLAPAERDAWEWGLESAVLSAQKARDEAVGAARS